MDDDVTDDDDGTIPPVALTWRLPTAAVLEFWEGVFDSLSRFFSTMCMGVVADHNYRESQVQVHREMQSDLETLTKEL